MLTKYYFKHFLLFQDVCKTTIFYSEQMCSKVVKQDSKAEFEVSTQLCLAINNIDFVLQYIRPFIEELGIDDIVDKLRVLNGDLVATSCKRTLVCTVLSNLLIFDL
jgi:hypothetical protein